MCVILNYYINGFSVIDILDVFFEFIKISTSISESLKYSITQYIINSIIVFNEIHEDNIELSFFTSNIYRIIKNI